MNGNFDLEWSSDLGLRPRLGGEWHLSKMLALRGGFWLGNLTTGAALTPNFSAGFGILFPQMELDYTILPDRIIPWNFMHRIALIGKFL